MIDRFNVVIIGAGAAGMMCAIEAGKRGKRVLILDHAKKIGEKIRISGGGRCNFTNINTDRDKFISSNPNFIISALTQYTYRDFTDLLDKYKVEFHEKKLGQLFCNNSAQQIIDMLKFECDINNVIIKDNININSICKKDDMYLTETNNSKYLAKSLVIATGGLSVPKIGASKFGYDIAKKFNLKIIQTYPALVPLTLNQASLEKHEGLAGVSFETRVSCDKTIFEEGMLFTHRGLSGPSILQISSYWQQGKKIQINLSPKFNILDYLNEKKKTNPKQEVYSIISEIIPKKLATMICNYLKISGKVADLSKMMMNEINKFIHHWNLVPEGTEGYRIAEVTKGGVDTRALSSQTMMSKNNRGLYFIGEVLDVTGHLGGYNFQWAWSSGYVAGQHV